MAHRIDAAVTRVRTVGDNLEFNYKDGTKLEIGSDGSGTIYYNNGNSEKLSKNQILKLQQAASVYLVDEEYQGYNDYNEYKEDYNYRVQILNSIDSLANEDGTIKAEVLFKNLEDLVSNNIRSFDVYDLKGYLFDIKKLLSNKLDKNGCVDIDTVKQAIIKVTKDTKDDQLYYFQLIAKHEKEPDKYPIYDAGDFAEIPNNIMNQNVEFDSLPDKIKQVLPEDVIEKIKNGNVTKANLMEYLANNKNNIGL